MKTKLLIILILLFNRVVAQESEFRVQVPSITATNKLTSDMFKGSNAVILLKEQEYSEGPHSRWDISQLILTDDVTIDSKRIVAKVFNDAGVHAFGSFEYEYRFSYAREEQDKFTVRARVIKPDSTVWVMPQEAVSIITGEAAGNGRPITKKAIFKLSNLAPGDIIQVEYTHLEPNSHKRKVIYFYHDRYPVLTSRVYVNMTKEEKVDYLSYPPDKITESKEENYRWAKRRSWSTENLEQVPDEPFSRPFADVSYLTAIVDRSTENEGDGWRSIAKDYVRYNLAGSSIPKSFMRDIGLDPDLKNPSWVDVEQAYTALRKYFVLETFNDRFPDTKKLDELIESKEANASDLAYMMMRLLDRWDVTCTPVFIRDRREGMYERQAASIVWFDRLGLLVTLGGAGKVYDFDRCIPTRFEFPWFLRGASVFAMYDTGAAHLTLSSSKPIREYISGEYHFVTFKDKVRDSVVISLKGALAQKLRGNLYTVKGTELTERLSSILNRNVLRSAESPSINDFLNEREIRLTGQGISQGGMTQIDSFITLHVRGHLLRDLREKFTATVRYDNIYLEEPFVYSTHWSITAPAGYRFYHHPEPVSLEGVAGTSATISYLQPDSLSCSVQAEIIFNTDFIKATEYQKLQQFLDSAMNAVEREITFKKN